MLVVASPEAMTGDGIALLEGHLPISQEQLEALLDGNPSVSVAVKDVKGNIVYQAKGARLFSRAQKRAMVAESPSCVFEDCTRPAVNATAHHIQEFHEGGETTIFNGASLCPPHSDRVHADGWVVLRDPGGGYRTLPPGHPDNPKSWMEPAAYIRQRREAIFRQRNKRLARDRSGAEPEARRSPRPDPASEGSAAPP